MTAITLPPFKPLPMLPPKIYSQRRGDGTYIIRSLYDLGPMHRSIAHLFEERARQHPGRNLLAQRTPAGPWRFITYGEANQQASAIAQALLDRNLGPDTPLLILSGNSIEHAIMMLGAMKARVPVAPVSVAYSLFSQDHGKLRHVAALTKPKMIFVDNGPLYAKAIKALDLSGVEIITMIPAADMPSTSYETLTNTNAGTAVRTSIEAITHDTVAKYLFTSGSTGMPKGVIQTHGMMCAVVAGGESLRAEPPNPDEIPESLEWMPWNHISAGNIGFNGNLNAGGTIYLDNGKPIPGMFEETMRNLREISPLVFGSAPIAFAMLASAMERDDTLRDKFFAKLRYMGYGGATLSDDLYDRMQALAIKSTGRRLALTTMYGATETQGITVVHWITERVGLIGLPLPGVTLKLVPNGQKLEVRVKGPTVTPGYLNRPDLTQAAFPDLTQAAFDEEGFYKLGDAAKFVDPLEPAKGLIFDGRVTEDFKLSSGTWVSVGTLRAEVISATSPLIQDCVIAGLDKEFVAVLAWPNMTAALEICADANLATPDEILRSPAVIEFVRASLRKHNKNAGGSSGKVQRLMLMSEPPSIDGHEITDKGYVNQSATLDRRAKLVDALYAKVPPGDVIVV